ncbi:MAG: amino acid adenylation domain-containing protein [Caulobacteraceae bacterium]
MTRSSASADALGADPSIPSLDAMVRRAFRDHAGMTAISKAGRVQSYAELFETACGLAGLFAECVADGEAVGILAQRSFIAYAAVLGAVLAGRPWVPLNMKFPFERQLAMAKIARCALLVSDRKSAARHRQLDSELGLAGAMITEEALPPPARSGAPEPTAAPQDEELAYVMFTSGTTGLPKGVAARRSNLAAYLRAIEQVAPLPAGSRCTQLFDLSFDLSVHDLFRTWMAGGALWIMEDEEMLDPVGFACRNELECWFSVPSVVAMAQRLDRLNAGALPALRLSLFCGEALPLAIAEAWARAAPNSRILNLYGPTEATIAITACEFRRRIPASNLPVSVPLGAAFRGSAAVAMSDAGAPVAQGGSGELWLGGDQITAGYLNNPQETERKFVARSIEGFSWRRWYRTGDLVQRDPVHGLVFEGRLDDQIKLQGYRVELLEIEAALRAASGASEVAAVPWPISPTGAAEGIVGFVCGARSTEREIISDCRKRLASYMVPRRISFVDQIPLNANGKVDRKALVRLLDL